MYWIYHYFQRKGNQCISPVLRLSGVWELAANSEGKTHFGLLYLVIDPFFIKFSFSFHFKDCHLHLWFGAESNTFSLVTDEASFFLLSESFIFFPPNTLVLLTCDFCLWLGWHQLRCLSTPSWWKQQAFLAHEISVKRFWSFINTDWSFLSDASSYWRIIALIVVHKHLKFPHRFSFLFSSPSSQVFAMFVCLSVCFSKEVCQTSAMSENSLEQHLNLYIFLFISCCFISDHSVTLQW